MGQNEFEMKMKQDFIVEAMEMLGRVEAQLLLFKQNPTDSKVIDEIFRMAHTLKGSAVTCGFTRLGTFAHTLEALLVKIQDGRHRMDAGTFDVLLRANDAVRSYLTRLKSDPDATLDADAIEDSLRSYPLSAGGAAADNSVSLETIGCLGLKAFLFLSSSRNEAGIELCLETLEELLEQVALLREA